MPGDPRDPRLPPGGLTADVAVVIPVLDEERRIARRLAELAGMPGVAEVVVVDGGSRDRTVAEARRFPAVRVLAAPRGRGTQLNAGARATGAPVLLFLHADVSLPPDATTWVRRALADPAAVGGAFRTRHLPDPDLPPSWVTPLLPLADLRSRLSRLPYGDQAMFVRRDAFERVGGFPDQPVMEDLALSRRLRRIGRLVTVAAAVTVSGRRFQRHPLRAAVLMRALPLLYRAGVPPRVLARLYGDPR